jgi:nitrilase
VGPLGQVLAGPDFDGETILTAEIDRRDLARARMDFDAVGHYARPDVFQLHVDETPRAAVTFRGSASSGSEERHEMHETTNLQI